MTAENKKNSLGKPFLTTSEAAAWLGLTKNTLEKMRVHGNGPLYRKQCRYVGYPRRPRGLVGGWQAKVDLRCPVIRHGFAAR
jgi:hypothetical protein